MPLEVQLVFPQTLLLLYDGLAIKQILSCFVFILPEREKIIWMLLGSNQGCWHGEGCFIPSRAELSNLDYLCLTRVV